MAPWLLPVFIFLVWSLWIGASAMGVAVENARRGTPEAERSGVSILPGMPLFPLAFWGIALAGNWAAPPWGSILVVAFHVAFGGTLIVSIVRSIRALRAIDGPT